jgi:hypothetical protein
MKTLRKPIVLTMLLLSLMPFSTHASSIVPGLSTTKSEKLNPIDDQKLINRLEEIKSMDIKNLNRKERKELRREVKSIQKVQSTGNGGVYLSVGAIIIIILLLILIL